MLDTLKRKLVTWLKVPDVGSLENNLHNMHGDLRSQVEAYQDAISKRVDEIEGIVKELVEVECANCGKHFTTYPYGGGYYTSQQDRKFCSGECLEIYQKEH